MAKVQAATVFAGSYRMQISSTAQRKVHSVTASGGAGGHRMRSSPVDEQKGYCFAARQRGYCFTAPRRALGSKIGGSPMYEQRGYCFTAPGGAPGSEIWGSSTAELMEKHYAFTVTGGAGGSGTQISTAPLGILVGSGFGVGTTPETLAIANEKITMQHLNSRPAKLQKANSAPEIKILEAIKKRGPLEGRDYSKYEAIIAELRAKILDMIEDNAQLAIALDSAHLASDDFVDKMEHELSMRQSMEADIAGLRKVLVDTNVIRLRLESNIKSLQEELISLRRYHEMDVAELRAQITKAGVRVDVDAPKGQDLTRIMEEIRALYEKIALKNQEELKAWHESQITEVQVQVTESSTALKEATTAMTETRRTCQELEIQLQSELSLTKLRDIEASYKMETEKYDAIILRLQEELAHIGNDIQHNSGEYENLLSIKVKLEAEIAEYRRLLDGGDLQIEDAVDSVQTQVVTLTQTLVDGKVVSESKDVKSSEKVVD